MALRRSLVCGPTYVVLMRRLRWLGLVVVMVGSVGCGTEDKPVVVSHSCSEAWATYAKVVASGGERSNGERGIDRFTDGDEAAVQTLHRCSTPDEWWAGSGPYRSKTIGDADKDETLTDWCSAYEESEPNVCLAR